MMRLAALALTLAACAVSAAAVDPNLPPYEPLPVAPPAGARYVRPDGSVHIVLGNRGIGVVIEGFNALFARTHPGTRFSVEYNKEGNTLNMAALVPGTTLFCPLARAINDSERRTYAQVGGGEPLVVDIAHGTLTSVRMTPGLAVHVLPHNHIHRLNTDQLARVLIIHAPRPD